MPPHAPSSCLRIRSTCGDVSSHTTAARQTWLRGQSRRVRRTRACGSLLLRKNALCVQRLLERLKQEVSEDCIIHQCSVAPTLGAQDWGDAMRVCGRDVRALCHMTDWDAATTSLACGAKPRTRTRPAAYSMLYHICVSFAVNKCFGSKGDVDQTRTRHVRRSSRCSSHAGRCNECGPLEAVRDRREGR